MELIYMWRLTENSQGDLIIAFPLGHLKYLVIFVVDTGAQMSAFQSEVAALVNYATQEKELDTWINTQWIASF